MGPDPAQPLTRTRAGQTRLPGPCSAIPRQTTNCGSQTALAALLLISGLEGKRYSTGVNMCKQSLWLTKDIQCFHFPANAFIPQIKV